MAGLIDTLNNKGQKTMNPVPNHTTNIAEFGHVEREEAGQLLTTLGTLNDKTKNFSLDGVHVMFNKMSGYVFLTNDEYQVAMLDGKELLDYYSCPDCGHEGFAHEFEDVDSCCKDYMRDMGELS